MRKLLFAAALAVSAAANAEEIGLRVGLESPVYTHFSNNGKSGSYWLGDSLQPAVNVLLEYYPLGPIGIGAEIREGFAATGSNSAGLNYKRTGTSIGPNATLDLAPLPLYARAAIPIHVEPDSVHIDFRAGGGLKILILYAELTMDFPLAGSDVSAFSGQQLNIGAGVWLKF